MRLKDIQNTFHYELDSIYEKDEVDRFFFMLIDSFYNVSRLELAIQPDFKIANQDVINDALKRLKQEQPIQYILGETEFYGLPFKVNKNVLIPRPETEELVDWIISELGGQNSELRVLDIGTGSGCIAVSLAKNIPNAKVYALDVSKEALKTAKHNAALNAVEIECIEADILSFSPAKLISASQKFDVIVSNPPYVREQEKQHMKRNVLHNEPHLALFVKDENALLFYEAISIFAINSLNEKGQLFFEINEYLGNDMVQLLKDNQFKNIELKQDIFKKDRMIKGTVNLNN